MIRKLLFILLIFLSINVYGQIDTLGNTTVGAADGIPADQPRFFLYTATSSGPITGGAVYQNSSGGTYAGKMILYADNGDSSPGVADTLVALSNEVSTTSNGWIAFTFSTAPNIVAGNKYYLGIYVAPSSAIWGYRTVATGTEWRDPAAGVYASMPGDLSSFTLLTQSKEGAWYVTYDASLPSSSGIRTEKNRTHSGFSEYKQHKK